MTEEQFNELLIAQVREDERQAVIKEIEELLVDDPPTPNEETYLRNQVRARYRAELRAKLVEMKEE